jgi:hypothetical protein
MYPLMQTNIINFRDLALIMFQKDIKNMINIVLLPLSLGASLDPIEFFKKEELRSPTSKAVTQFVFEIANATESLENEGYDTSRLLMIISVKLSLQKIFLCRYRCRSFQRSPCRIQWAPYHREKI